MSRQKGKLVIHGSDHILPFSLLVNTRNVVNHDQFTPVMLVIYSQQEEMTESTRAHGK